MRMRISLRLYIIRWLGRHCGVLRRLSSAITAWIDILSQQVEKQFAYLVLFFGGAFIATTSSPLPSASLAAAAAGLPRVEARFGLTASCPTSATVDFRYSKRAA